MLAKNRVEEATACKSDLLLKMTCLENKISSLQHELDKKVDLTKEA